MDKIMKKAAVAAAALLLLMPAVPARAAQSPLEYERKPQLAIVIDDFGNNGAATKEFIAADFPFTAAVMPNSPFTESESLELVARGKDVILHMPMDSRGGRRSWLGKVYLNSSQSDEEIRESLTEALLEVHGAIGMNNHMGGRATEDPRIMRVVMEVLKERGLFVLDSVTSGKSVIKGIADEMSVPYFERTVFLDDTDKAHVVQNFKKAVKLAKEHGFAIAIGHINGAGGIGTYNAIADNLDYLEQEGVELVFLSSVRHARG